MLQKKKIILLYLSACCLSSCIKDVGINIPKQSPKLVVNCLFNPENNWKVFVGSAMPLTDTATISAISNADITLNGDNVPVDLRYSDSGYYLSNLKPKAGVKYTITVSVPGFDPIEATDSIPAGLSVTSYKLDTIPVLITPSDIFDNVKVNKLAFSLGKSNIHNYIQLQALSYSKSKDRSKLEGIFAQAPPLYNITGDYYSVFAEIKKEEGGTDFSLYTSYDAFNPNQWGNADSESKKDVEISIVLLCLSHAAYQFKTSYIMQQLNRQNPFSDPVQVYSNIKGGFGIFAGYQEQIFRIF